MGKATTTPSMESPFLGDFYGQNLSMASPRKPEGIKDAAKICFVAEFKR